MSTGSDLEIRDLHVHYGASHVLQGVDLRVYPGEVLAVVGRNGVGKTTLVAAIMGLLSASMGRVLYGGIDLLELPAHARRAHGFALVPQGRRVFRSLTVEEHLKLLRGADDQAQSVLGLFPRLKERLQSRAATLSGGEQSMLAIARALLGDPEVLIMDEPTEGLAPRLRETVASAVTAARERGVTVLLVEQNLTFTLSVCDRIAVMDRGRIVRIDERNQSDLDVEALARRILGAEPGVTPPDPSDKAPGG